MRAVLVASPGGPEELSIGNAPEPALAPGELLVEVRAAGVNRADILQRQGRYPPPPGASPLIGLEISGTVLRAASPSDRGAGGRKEGAWREGERICALLPGGGYAERAAVPAELSMPIPDGLSFEEAAAVPEVFLTAYQCLVWHGGLRLDAPGRPAGRAREEGAGADESPGNGPPTDAPRDVLVHAGASGVGTAALQLVREAGARSMATAGSARKLDACRALGASLALDYHAGPFAPKVLEATDGRGVDVVLDFVGAPYWEQNVSCLAPDGRLILIGTLGGRRVEAVDLGALMRKRARVVGTTLRARSPSYKARLTHEVIRSLLPRFAEGRLRPVLDRVFPMEEVAAAHRYMEENRNVGKIVLRVGASDASEPSERDLGRSPS